MARTVQEMRQQQAQEPDEGPEQGGPSRARRILRIVLVVLLVLAVTGAAAYWTVLRSGDDEAAAEESEESEEPEEGEVVEVAEMTANLAGGDLRFARVGIALVLEEGREAAEVEGRFPLMQDAALDELAAMTPEELTSEEGVAQLRDRLTDRAHEIYDEGEVVRVALTELIIQ
ncbi:flagellar basal body-associated FliL family protein [Egibacter rhizosphaerae]|uniref:Flagellar protein FliL n=1 Tax=Egibacter rhizosphaerae TaxID=1670831 RepID=A0A411YIW2_9ACTN|nr:flagellar basal body-associated FliL family protein [Egibacter rhizosphaerae]QBI21245.1 flagellar basal body-associated FliL family protein [Egibacter rhizosphaerae]